MDRPFQPLLLENLRLRWPGFSIRRLALNQHMPRVERLEEHAHRYAQILVYLRGAGLAWLGSRRVPVARGSVLVIPSGLPHHFEKTQRTRPICLVIDFDVEDALPWREVSLLSAHELASVERWLLALHEQGRAVKSAAIQSAALILQLLALLERHLSDRTPSHSEGPVTKAVRSLLRHQGLVGWTPGRVAQSLGRSLDHLNRQLRAESGTTLGGLLTTLRLEAATRALRESEQSIGEIASTIGMDDQNYFARWFRQHTGQSPSRWRTAMRGNGSAG